MHNSVESESALPQIDEIVSDVVNACLIDIDEIVEVYLAGLVQVDGYAAGVIPAEDLRDTAFASMELLLRLIGNLPLTA
jgi:hypothetical protein